MLSRPFSLLLAIAALNGAVAVAAAAYAAHGLAEPEAGLMRTGSAMQLAHAVAVTAVAAFSGRWPNRLAAFLALGAAATLLLGMMLFAGGLYRAAFGLSAALAPTGGSLLIAGWLLLALSGLAAAWRR